jgi:hypothetical protein
MAMNELLVNHYPGGPSRMEAPFCTECGQLLGGRTRELSWQGAAHPWWAWGLIALGVYLAIAFGVKTYQAYELAASRLEDLRQVASSCVAASDVRPGCEEDAAMRGLDPKLGRLRRYTDARGEWQRDLATATIGLLVSLIGIGVAARPLVASSAGPKASSWGRSLWLLLRVADLGSSVLMPCAQVFLGASFGLAVVRLLRGAPPSWELVAGSVQRTIELVIAVAHIA